MDDSGRPDLVDDSRFQRVLAEYQQRAAGGEQIDDEAFVAAHPDMADALRSWFATSSRARKPGDSADGRPSDSVFSTTFRPLSSRDTIPPGEKAVELEPAAPSLPEMFGRYRILQMIGQGAMGAVYLAEDTQLEREVALKIPKFAPEDGAEMVQRFYREAQSAATLRHANVCPVHDVGEINGTHYLTMAYIEGKPLSEIIKSQPRMPESKAVEIVLKLARALAAAHAEGIIHRDLKPANIMIDEHGEPIIMDFGLARRIKNDDARLTQAGLVVGSPAYMSPEQVEGDLEKMGPGCDIYSLGIIFYELLAGDIPFKGSVAAVMGQIITVTPKKPSEVRRGVDPRLEAVCLKMIAKKIEDRYESMSDVVAALESHRTMRVMGPGTNEARRSTIPWRGTETEPGARVAHVDSQRFVLRPWMVWTAVIVVLAGFGVTGWVLNQILQSMIKVSDKAPAVSPLAQQEFKKKNLSLYLDTQLIGPEKFNEPLDLPPGDHQLEIRSGNMVQDSRKYSVPVGKQLRLKIEFKDDALFFDTEMVDLTPADGDTKTSKSPNSSLPPAREKESKSP